MKAFKVVGLVALGLLFLWLAIVLILRVDPQGTPEATALNITGFLTFVVAATLTVAWAVYEVMAE